MANDNCQIIFDMIVVGVMAKRDTGDDAGVCVGTGITVTGKCLFDRITRHAADMQQVLPVHDCSKA